MQAGVRFLSTALPGPEGPGGHEQRRSRKVKAEEGTHPEPICKYPTFHRDSEDHYVFKVRVMVAY